MKKKYFSEEEKRAANVASVKRSRDKNIEVFKLREKIARAKKKETTLAYNRARRKTYTGYIDRFLERSKIRTPDTDIDREFLVQLCKETCAVSGVQFQYENPYECFHNPLAPSIDRIDSTVGYYKANIQIILACINRMKGEMPNEEFMKLWKALTGVEPYAEKDVSLY